MHTCVSYIKWLKTPLKSLNSDSNRSHGDLPSRQITMYFFILLKHEITFPTLLASVREGTENIDACFYLKILVFFYCFFFWFLVLDFTMFYICCNEKKIVVLDILKTICQAVSCIVGNNHVTHFKVVVHT